MADRAQLTVDAVIVGLTRPPTLFGVPYQAFILFAAAVVAVFILASDLRWLLLAAPIYAGLYAVTLKDPRFVDVFLVIAARTPTTPNRSYWGANSFSP